MNNEAKRTRRPPTEREVEGLFRLVGEGANPDIPVSEEEAEFLLRIAEQMAVTEEEVDEGTRWMMERLCGQSGTNAVASLPEGQGAIRECETGADASQPERRAVPERPVPPAAGRALQHRSGAAEAPTERMPEGASAPAPTGTGGRVSFIAECKRLGKKVADAAKTLRVESNTLLLIDRGEVDAVPDRLILDAARLLGRGTDEIRRAFSPHAGEIPRMAAHGKPGAHLRQVKVRPFLEVIEQSRAPEADKQYWRAVVEAETRP